MIRLAHFSDIHLTARPLGWRVRDAFNKRPSGWVNVAVLGRGASFKHANDVTGALRRLPISAGLFLAGFFAITGSPPFGPFVSELSVLTAAMDARRYVVGALYLILLAVIFIGMGSTVLAVVQGVPPEDAEGRSFRESAFKTVPIIVSLALVVMMGVWIPGWILTLLHAAARLLGGS